MNNLRPEEAKTLFAHLVISGGAPSEDLSAFIHKCCNGSTSQYMCLPKLGTAVFSRVGREVKVECDSTEDTALKERCRALTEEMSRFLDESDKRELIVETVSLVSPSFEIMTPSDWMRCFPVSLEVAGRVCYKSEERITSQSADEFVRRIIKRGHESVLEHCSVTVKIICDRSCSHQLVRHRIASYLQESQRFCDYSSKGFQIICPPSISNSSGCVFGFLIVQENNLLKGDLYQICGQTVEPFVPQPFLLEWIRRRFLDYSEYVELRKRGIPPEDARSVLPNCTKTEIVATFNLRQWRHVFKERALNKHSQWQIRMIFSSILEEFSKLLPCVFENLVY